MLTIAPSAARNASNAKRVQRNVPNSTMSTTLLKPLGESSSDGQTKLPAALLTSTSMRPVRAAASRIAASTRAASRTSPGSANAFPPAASIEATVSASLSLRRPMT